MQQTPLKRQEDIGLSPYELKFRGQHRSKQVKLAVFDICAEEIKETVIHSIEELQSYKDKLIWLNIDGLHNEKLMGELAESIQIPSDILSDVMEPGTRPQTEEFDNGLFISIKMMHFNETLHQVSIDNLSVILMNNWVITFQEENSSLFDPIKERIKKHNKRFCTMGADYLAFAILDVVIDNYIYILGMLGVKIEDQDYKLVLNPDRETLKIINMFKRQLTDLGRYIKPAREMISSLVKMDSDFVTKKNYKHFKELHDNINQSVELLDYYHEVLYDELNIYHSSMSTRLNDIMALLTVFSVIFIPLTFIVGVYGMNFDNMPELHFPNAYFIVWIVMILIAAVMLWYFKRRKWF